MHLATAEKLIFVGSAAKIGYKDMKGAQEKEHELLCQDVNEASFGDALMQYWLMLFWLSRCPVRLELRSLWCRRQLCDVSLQQGLDHSSLLPC